MELKPAKIIFFAILLTCFGLGQVSQALNYSNSIKNHSEINDLIAKEGGGGKKGGGKKSGGKKSGVKKSGDKKNESSLNKVQSNNEAMREEAKERYKKWKENKNLKNQI